jgi:hypothetical protein
MDFQEAFASLMGEYWGILAGVTLFICLLSLLLYFLGVMGQTGLIKGVSLADGGAASLSFGELWSAGLRYFWRMFLLGLLVGLPFLIIVLVLLVLLFGGIFGLIAGRETGTMVGGLIAALAVFVPAICCLAILRIVVDMIVDQAKNAIVIEDMGVIEALRRGWEIFKDNFLTIVLLAIILGVLGGIIGFVIAIPIIIAVLPAIGSGVLLQSGADQAAALTPLALAGICCVVYFPVLLVLNGIMESYLQSVWTLTYLRITSPIPPAAPSEPPVVPEIAQVP